MNDEPLGQLLPVILFNRPLNRVIFDYLGPLTFSNNKQYILVSIYNNTKYIFTKTVTTTTEQSTVDFLIQIISRWRYF